MLLQQINLKNFRNYKKDTFKFSPFLTIVIGENARGKTNLLEGVYFLANGTGFRESKELELINYTVDGHSSVEGTFISDESRDTFAITLVARDELLQKTFLVNKTKKRHADYVEGQIKTVLFSPEQIDIIIGPPHNRREYFNILISTYDIEYKKKNKKLRLST